MAVLFWCRRLLFGGLGASILRLRGIILAPWADPEGPWEQQKGHVAVGNWILKDFHSIWGPHLESSSGAEGKKYGFLFELDSRLLLVFESRAGHLVPFKPGFRMESIAKSNFSYESDE